MPRRKSSYTASNRQSLRIALGLILTSGLGSAVGDEFGQIPKQLSGQASGLQVDAELPVYPFPAGVDLKPAMALKSHIAFVKTIQPGTPVSYGSTFVAKEEMRIATIPVGYADGYPRSLSNKGYVLIRGRRAPIVGRICMDQFMVDVSHIKDAQFGDKVTLIGKDGEEYLSVEILGDLSERFNYEFVCDLGKRIPRVYMHDGKVEEQIDYFAKK